MIVILALDYKIKSFVGEVVKMTSEWRYKNWQLQLIGFLAVSGALSELAGVNFFGTNYVLAQITPDRSLGAEASVVTPNVELKGNIVDRIDGGAIRDTNLFHSFEQFNIGDGQQVYFANPADITNIFSRVTGSNISEILGTLGVTGNANLFFINPNGIIFGENASLDVGGSFVASTADAIQFGDRGFFSATDPEQPPLLTVKPSAFFFNQIKAGRIENRSTAPAGVDLLERPVFGLRVPDGKSLLLLGGDIAIDGGELHAPDGRVELAGVADDGTVGLNVDGNKLNLNFPEDIARADISLTNEAFVNTSGEGGGEIAVWGRQVKLSDGSQIAATTLGSKAGRGLTVDASESVELTGTTADNRLPSGLFTQTGGTGDAGDLTINTKHLLVQNRARVLAGTVSQGNAGNLTVNASESVQMSGATGIIPFEPSSSSRLGSHTESGKSNTKVPFASRLLVSPSVAQTSATGKGGNVTIMTRQLRLQGAARIGASSFGEGDGGNLTVNATESVQVIEGDLFAQANSTGDAGDLTINTRELLVQDGAQVAVSSFGEGNAGSLAVNATESVQVIGSSADGQFPSGLLSRAERGSTGGAGDLTVRTQQLLVQDGATVSASTFGEGDGGDLTVNASESVQVIGSSADGQPSSLNVQANRGSTGRAGNLTVRTRQLLVQGGARVSAATFGDGDGGSLTVNASESLQVISTSANGQFPSFLSAQTQGSGNAGDLSITTGQLLIQDGAQVGAATFGEGDGRSLTVNASESVQVIGESANGQFSSALSAQTQGSGDAGKLSITTGQLLIQDGALVGASTFGEGEGGSLIVNASESVQVIGRLADGQFPGGLFVQAQGTGNAGDLSITTGQLLVKDGAFVSARSLEPESSAGKLKINANSILLNNQGIITAETTGGIGGNITMQIADNLTLRNNSTISARALGDANGGNIDIDANFVIAFPNQNNDIIARAEQGRGGNINIATKGIFGIEERSSTPPNETNDIDASSEFGLDGEVAINQLDINPAQGLEELPTEVIDVAGLVAQNLCSAGQEGEFIITGKGGLSPAPQDTLNTDAGWEDWRMVEENQVNNQQTTVPIKEVNLKNRDNLSTIIEAQGWLIAPNGNIVLTAQPTTVQSQDSWLYPFDCRLLRERE